MKRILPLTAFAVMLILGTSFLRPASAQNYDQNSQYYDDENRDVSYQTFYDELSPHGRWIDYPGQGYVWVPQAGPDFRPYSTSGHWVWTENYEWMWVSDYDWGWAPFHYGRWDYDPYYGWYWVPGYEWSPAWVAWRDGGDYYGWAPIRPGIHISINFNIGGYSPPYDFWCFAPRRYITSPRIYDYCVDRRQNVTIINHTTIIVNNFRYNNTYGFRSGPSRYEAERYVGRINPVRFRDSYTPGRTQFRNNEVSVYRPNVRRDDNRQFAPRQFDRYDRSTAGNNNGFRRNDNTADRRDDNVSTRGNNLPDRGNRAGTGRGDNNDFRQPRNNNNGQANPTDDRRVNRSAERTDQPNTNDRRFDRQNNGGPGDVRTNDRSQRQVPQQTERRQEQRQAPQQMERRQPPQQMERRQEQQQMERRQAPQQMERRQEQQQMERRQAPQQMERRQEQQQMERRQAPQQMERRQEQQQIERKQAPQQMERRQAPQQTERRQEQPQVDRRQAQDQQQPRQVDNRGQGNNDGSNGKGNGRKRF